MKAMKPTYRSTDEVHARAADHSQDGVMIRVSRYVWRIVMQDAADLSAERGVPVSPLLWVEEALIERDLSQRYQIRTSEPVPRPQRSLAEIERDYIAELLRDTNYNISQAARIAGIERHTLARYLVKYGIQREDRGREPAGAGLDADDDAR